MTDERYKKIMSDLGNPDSMSLYLVLKQLANEIEIETRDTCAKKVDHILYPGGGTFGDAIREGR